MKFCYKLSANAVKWIIFSFIVLLSFSFKYCNASLEGLGDNRTLGEREKSNNLYSPEPPPDIEWSSDPDWRFTIPLKHTNEVSKVKNKFLYWQKINNNPTIMTQPFTCEIHFDTMGGSWRPSNEKPWQVKVTTGYNTIAREFHREESVFHCKKYQGCKFTVTHKGSRVGDEEEKVPKPAPGLRVYEFMEFELYDSAGWAPDTGVYLHCNKNVYDPNARYHLDPYPRKEDE